MRNWAMPLLLLSGLLAQEPQRAKAIGQVLDEAGVGVAGAEVTLVNRAIGWAREYGQADVVTTVTDNLGRFAAQLYSGRSYSAHACWRRNEQPFVTSIKEHVAAGEFAVLRQLASKVIDFRVRLDGQKAWANYGPLQFRVYVHQANMHSLPVAVDADGLLVIPPLPGGNGTLEAVTNKGHVLWAARISSKHSTRRSKAAYRKGGVLELAVLALPKPVSIEVVTVTTAGKVVPHAELRHRSGWLSYRPALSVLDAADWSLEYWRPIGATDGEGKATVVVPAKGNPWTTDEKVDMTLTASAAGYADAFAGWSDGYQHKDLKTTEQSDRPLRIIMHTESPVSGRLTLDGEQPAAHLPILLTGNFDIMNFARSGGINLRGPIMVGKTDEKGAFRFPSAPRGMRIVHLVTPIDTPAVRAKLTRGKFAPPPSASPFAKNGTIVMRYEALRRERDFGETSLGFERAVSLQLLTPDGNPVRGGQVSLLSGNDYDKRMAVHGTTDSGGRCLLLPSDPDQVIVVVLPGVGYALEPLGKPGSMQLTLRPFAHAEGQVTWRDGKPAANARITCLGSKWEHGARHIGGPQILDAINDDICKARADAEGKFRIPYIPAQGASLRLFGTATREGTHHSGPVLLRADPGEQPPPLQIRIER